MCSSTQQSNSPTPNDIDLGDGAAQTGASSARWRLELLVVILYLAAYIAPLGIRPLFGPDEIRYSEIPREMLHSGDWVVPRIDGFRYFEKPVMGYWLNAVSISIFGNNPFAVRLPAALCAGGIALLLYWLIVRFGPGRREAGLAALALLFCPLFYGIGTFAVLDMPLTFFVTGTMVFAYAALYGGSTRERAIFWLLSGMFCGMAFLTKGFVGFVLPGLGGLAFVVWQRHWGRVLRWCWLPILAIVIVALPWAVAIHLREPDFWRYFILIEHVQRFLHAPSSQHPRAFWYFIPIIIGGTMPWAALLPTLFKDIRQTLAQPLARFALCWFALPFLFLSASTGKLATYILPCIPPVVLLVIIGLASNRSIQRRRIYLWPARLAAGVFAVLVVTLWAVQFAGIKKVPGWNWADESWKPLLLTLSLVATVACYLLTTASRLAENRRAILYGIAMIPFLVSAEAAVPKQILLQECPLISLDRIAPAENRIIASDSRMIQAVCLHYRRDDILLVGEPSELEYGTNYADSRSRHFSWKEFGDYLQDRQTERIVLFQKTRHPEHDLNELRSTPKSVSMGPMRTHVFNSPK